MRRRRAGETEHSRRQAHSDASQTESHEQARTSQVQRLHRRYGNQALKRLASVERSREETSDTQKTDPQKPSLEVAPAETPAEREADRVASTVVDALDDDGHAVDERVGSAVSPGSVQRRAGADLGGGKSAPESVHDAIESPGHMPDPTVRRLVEQASGSDLSDARVHTGSAVDRAARDIDAHAFAVGSDVALSRGAETPDVLAHELTHVAQQSVRGRAVQRFPRKLKGLRNALGTLSRDDDFEEHRSSNVVRGHLGETLPPAAAQVLYNRYQRGYLPADTPGDTDSGVRRVANQMAGDLKGLGVVDSKREKLAKRTEENGTGKMSSVQGTDVVSKAAKAAIKGRKNIKIKNIDYGSARSWKLGRTLGNLGIIPQTVSMSLKNTNKKIYPKKLTLF